MNRITIDLPKTDYRGGESIEGVVRLEIDEPLPARGVRLVLDGHEATWTRTGTGRHVSTTAVTHSLFQEEITLSGAPKLEIAALLKDVVVGIFSREHFPIIAKGVYEHAFSYRLPSPLPGDYESSHGDAAIRYQLRAYVDVPLRIDLEDGQGG
jgi:hypothetical protein